MPRLPRPKSGSLFNADAACSSRHVASSVFDQFSPKMQPRIWPASASSCKTPLHGNPDGASGSSRSVTVDDLEQRCFRLPRDREFAVETLQGLVDLWHIGLEI